ncbi:MAG: TonB-dependent receptor [Prevotellaceae bacterium]|jgi:TonB-linked SusC/RagA family outer membrane protein|nr:TonB-dependent receptor [Prevotellaceae bacterium]
MKRVIHILLGVSLLLCGGMVHAQPVVSGRVTDAKTQEPVAGVTVSVVGATTGALTGVDGSYAITAEGAASLKFQLMGYQTQTVRVDGRAVVNVSLAESAVDLDEVVVVGASLRKSDLTGAVSSVTSKTLEEKPVTTINEAIQGRVAGVFISQAAKPTDDASIKIRGTNSISTTTDPIYVVDGLVMDNFGSGWSAINVNDVASIEVLKDASATALYGSRASNGVVLITTKKGKAGEGKVTYDSWVGIQQWANSPQKMGAKDLYELRYLAYLNGFRSSSVYAKNPAYLDEYISNFLNAPIGTPTPTSIVLFAEYEKVAYRDNKNYDWVKEVTQPGLQQDHLLSFTGGSDRNAYYLSFGYSDHKGLVKNTGLTKYTGRINAEQLVKSWLKVGTNTSFTRTTDETVDDYILQGAWNANPMLPINPAEEPTLQAYLDANGYLPTLGYRYFDSNNNMNPIRSLGIENDRIRNRLLSSSYINLNPIEGLNLRTTFALDYVQEARYKYTPNDIQEAKRYSQYGQAAHTRDHRTILQWDNTITYEKVTGNHRFNLLAGASVTRNDRDYTYATGNGFGTNLLSYYRLNAAYLREQHDIGSEFSTSTLLAGVARANYAYADRYLLTATLRYDGSSKFMEEKQWGAFPSFSAAWNATEEQFMKNLLDDQNFLSRLKLRAGFGMVGNQEIGDFAFRSLYNPSVSNQQTNYVAQGRKGNEDISWEKQKQYNLGLDIDLLGSRVRIAADAFYIENKDLLMTHSLPATTGFSEIVENIGAITNKGVELSVDATVVKAGDFEWNVAATISADKNEVTQLYGNKDVVYNINGDRQIEKTGNLFLGESRNTIYILQTGGIAQAVDFTTDADGNPLFQGRPVKFTRDDGTVVDRWNGNNVSPGDLYPLDANNDGEITDADRVVIGSTDPKFYGGFSTELSWKGIALNAVFSYSYGAKKLSPYYEGLINSTGESAASLDLLNNTWTADNTGAEFPRPVAVPLSGEDYPHYSASNMDFSVQDASFLRLSAITLAYTLPASLSGKVGLSNVRFYATGSNLFCLTPYRGFDPEMGDWYPPTKMYVFGVNLSF